VLSDTRHYEGVRQIADVLPDSASAPLIVLVDQFEEVYTLCEDPIARCVCEHVTECGGRSCSSGFCSDHVAE